MKIIFDYNRTIFDPDNNCLYRGVLELLAKLSKKHKLLLISRQSSGRKAMIKQLKIESFFNDIVLTKKKTRKFFQELIANDKNTIIIGDRISEEIKIGNKLNHVTIWIKHNNNQDKLSKIIKPTHIITNIIQIDSILKQYE